MKRITTRMKGDHTMYRAAGVTAAVLIMAGYVSALTAFF